MERPRLPEGAPIYGPLIWILALLPLVSAAAVWLIRFDLSGFVSYLNAEQAYTNSGAGGTPPMLDPFSLYGPGYWVAQLLSFAVYGLSVVFAALDRRRLERIGVVRPFHWAWAFLSSPVYIIGRSVIVHRVASPRGRAPIWVWIAVTCMTLISVIVWTVVFFGQLAPQLQGLPTA